MPYIYKDNIEEGDEIATVYSEEDYKSVVAERDEASNQRDALLEQVTNLQKELRDQKTKYATTFLSQSQKPTPIEVPERNARTVSGAFTVNDLFGMKGN